MAEGKLGSWVQRGSAKGGLFGMWRLNNANKAMNYFLIMFDMFAEEQMDVGVSGKEMCALNSDWWDFTASEVKVELMDVVYIHIDSWNTHDL